LNFKAKKIFLALLLVTFILTPVYSQIIPTGKLVGFVTDTEDEPLPGVTVTISSPSMITPQMAFVTNEEGYYRFIGLPSGKYTVVYELPGFKSLRRESIDVTVTRTTSLNVDLEMSEIKAEVVVIGAAPTVNIMDTATGTTFDVITLEEMPVNRNVYEIQNLAPGVYDEASHGSDQLTNRYTVDGQNMSHPLHGVLTNEISFSSIEEITVGTGLHQADQGGVMGSVVQVITKSGGNDLSFKIGTYFQDKSLQSTNTKGTPFEGQFTGFDYQYEPYLSIGGAIKRDKAWFFASLDLRLYRYYVQGYPYDQPDNMPIDAPKYLPFCKLTWQITPKDKLTTSFSYYYATNNHSGASYQVDTDVTTKAPTNGMTFSSQWSKVVSSNFLFNARAGYFSNVGDRILKTDELRYYDYATRLYSGSGGYNHLNERGRAQFSTDSSYFIEKWAGSHELKVGGEFSYSWNNSHRTWNEDPYWQGVFGKDWRVSRIYTRNGVPEKLSLTQNYFRKERIINMGVFIQDAWTLSRHFVFNLGLRYDYYQTFWPKQMKGDTDMWAYEERTVAMTWNTLAPRLGISYDPFGDGKTAVKVSFGRYYPAHTTMLTNYAYGGAAWGMNAMLNPDWSVDYTYGLWKPLGQVDPEGLNPYWNDTFDISVEREIINNLSVSVTYIQKWEKNMIEGVDIYHVDTEYLREHGMENGHPKWIGYNIVYGTDPTTGNPVTFYEMDSSYPTDMLAMNMNIPGIHRKYRGVEVKLDKRMSNNWSFFTSYVWSKGEGLLGTNRFDSDGASAFFENPNVHVNVWGLLKHQREHMLKVQGMYIAPFGIQLSAQYFYSSGEPYPRQLRSSEAGLSLYQGRQTVIVEPYGSYYYPDLHELNIRLQKSFNVGHGRFIVLADIIRAFNANTTTSLGWITDVNWQDVIDIVDPSYFRLGVSYEF